MSVAIGFSNHLSKSSKFLFAGASDERCESVDFCAWIEEARGLNCNSLPTHAKSKISVAKRLPDVMNSIKSDELWKSAIIASDFYFAISIKVMEILKSSGKTPSFYDVPRFVLGSGFIQSIRNHGGFGDNQFSGTILDCCARVVLGNPKEPLKPFGRPKQMVRDRDSAKALRSHITSTKVGLRLMVWMKLCGTVEIANVGPKFEVMIEYGDEEGSYTVSSGRN
ncbi:hypothetical protein D3C72_1447730 [compost metagenome]